VGRGSNWGHHRGSDVSKEVVCFLCICAGSAVVVPLLMSLQVDKKVLQSQYSRNNLNIHYKLVRIYVTNLNSLATTTALMVRLSFGSIQEFDYPTYYISSDWRFGYFYSLFSMLTVVCGILALSQTTICLIFGPTMFLFGHTHSDSLSALQTMRQQQKEGFFWSCSCIAMAFLQTLFYEWGITTFPLACIITILLLVGTYVIYIQGLKTMKELSPPASLPITVVAEQDPQPTLQSYLLALSPGMQDHQPPTLSFETLHPSNFSKVEDIHNVRPYHPPSLYIAHYPAAHSPNPSKRVSLDEEYQPKYSI
jgi:hypothetical protein